MAQRHDTQLSRIREHLLQGKYITPLDALNLYGCFRLSAVIFNLRHDENIPICMDQPMATNGKPYARYWIDPEYIIRMKQEDAARKAEIINSRQTSLW